MKRLLHQKIVRDMQHEVHSYVLIRIAYMHAAVCPSVWSEDRNSDNVVDYIETDLNDSTGDDIDSDGGKGCNTTKDVPNSIIL